MDSGLTVTTTTTSPHHPDSEPHSRSSTELEPLSDHSHSLSDRLSGSEPYSHSHSGSLSASIAAGLDSAAASATAAAAAAALPAAAAAVVAAVVAKSTAAASALALDSASASAATSALASESSASAASAAATFASLLATSASSAASPAAWRRALALTEPLGDMFLAEWAAAAAAAAVALAWGLLRSVLWTAALALFGVWWAQGLVLYMPTVMGRSGEKRQLRYNPPGSRTPAEQGLPYEEVFLRAADGVLLHAWFIPQAADHVRATCPTVIYFHGNAGSTLTDRLETLRCFGYLAQTMARLRFDLCL